MLPFFKVIFSVRKLYLKLYLKELLGHCHVTLSATLIFIEATGRKYDNMHIPVNPFQEYFKFS